ncbi:hypothetical protein QJQ45_021265, partial [Haematococcus lacustris]
TKMSAHIAILLLAGWLAICSGALNRRVILSQGELTTFSLGSDGARGRSAGRPPGAHLPWGIRMERSDAAAWENEEQRKSDYISYALVQQELLANKSLALQSAMQQQINSAWELHASEHVACSYGPSPLQQVQHHEVEYIDIQHRFKLTVWQCTGCAACANPIRFHCWPSSQRQASIWYDISLLRHFMEAWFAGLSEDAYLKSLIFTHYPLTLYPPKPIKTASFSAAFFDYLRVTHRASTMAELVGSCHADMLPSGAVADCPLCASLPGAPPEDGYIRTLSADACLQPSSYAGAARATRHIKQHINTYLDPSGLEGDVLKLQASNQLTLKGAFAAAAAQSSGASAGGADLADPDGASEATADVSSHAADCSASLSCARPHTSNVSAGQPCDIRGIVGFVCCHGIAVPQLFCNMRTPEQFVYYLLAMARLVHMCFGLVLHVYIDFACQFKVTWARYARVVGLDTARTHLMVNWMHGASHDLGCQLKNNGRYLATAAWRVGEQTEQLWSMFKAMSPLLRYMTRANRADAVQARLSAIAFNKQADMLAALEKQHKSMLKKEEELNQKISDLRARAFADGVTDEALARKAFVDSYLNPEACSVRPNDWWLAVWVQLLLELKALEAVAFGLSLEGARSPIRLPSVTLQPDFAQLLTRRTGKTLVATQHCRTVPIFNARFLREGLEAEAVYLLGLPQAEEEAVLGSLNACGAKLLHPIPTDHWLLRSSGACLVSVCTSYPDLTVAPLPDDFKVSLAMAPLRAASVEAASAILQSEHSSLVVGPSSPGAKRTMMAAEHVGVKASLSPSDLALPPSLSYVKTRSEGGVTRVLLLALGAKPTDQTAAASWAASLAVELAAALPHVAPACYPTVEAVGTTGVVEVAACLPDVDAAVSWLATQPSVIWVEYATQRKPANLLASAQMQTGRVAPPLPDDGGARGYHPLWEAGLDGAGQLVGVVDTGLDMGSCYFWDPAFANFSSDPANLYTDPDTGTRYFHNNAHRKASGQAPAAKLAMLDAGLGDDIDLPTNPASLFELLYQAGARVLSNAWTSDSFSYTVQGSFLLDTYLWSRPDLLMLFPAGKLCYSLPALQYHACLPASPTAPCSGCGPSSSLHGIQCYVCSCVLQCTHMVALCCTQYAGNHGGVPNTQLTGNVASSALAKNVVAVGATDNYTPLDVGNPGNTLLGANNSQVQIPPSFIRPLQYVVRAKAVNQSGATQAEAVVAMMPWRFPRMKWSSIQNMTLELVLADPLDACTPLVGNYTGKVVLAMFNAS